MDLGSIKLRSGRGRERTIDEFTTLFDLCLVVLDARQPSCNRELLAVVERIDEVMSGADCIVGVLLVAADEDDVERALGSLAKQVAVFVDPGGEAVTALGVSAAPALVWITTVPEIGGVVQGWDPLAWRSVLDRLAHKLAWTRPLLPQPGDPAPFPARALNLESTRRVYRAH